jgi:hypothetical protein
MADAVAPTRLLKQWRVFFADRRAEVVNSDSHIVSD